MNDNFQIKLDLSKFNGSGVTELISQDGARVKAVVIPIEANNIFISDNGRILLDLQAFKTKEENQKVFGNFKSTYSVKVLVDAEKYKNLSQEEKMAIPFVGNIYEYIGVHVDTVKYSQTGTVQPVQQTQQVPQQKSQQPAQRVDDDPELPF